MQRPTDLPENLRRQSEQTPSTGRVCIPLSLMEAFHDHYTSQGSDHHLTQEPTILPTSTWSSIWLMLMWYWIGLLTHLIVKSPYVIRNMYHTPRVMVRRLAIRTWVWWKLIRTDLNLLLRSQGARDEQLLESDDTFPLDDHLITQMLVLLF